MEISTITVKCDACGRVHTDEKVSAIKLYDKTLTFGDRCANALMEMLIHEYGLPSKYNDE